MSKTELGHSPPHEFIAEVAKSIAEGHGIVPLVGSGVSVESGIPTGDGLGVYLHRVLAECVQGTRDVDRDGWPSLAATLNGEPSDLPLIAPQGREHLQRIYDEAHRACGRWNDMLVLLSRLRVEKDEPRLVGAAPRVIDALGHLLIRAARPNFGHNMLAQLSRALRVQTVLTTNFDDLLERAFTEARLPLAVYEVSSHGNLPDPRIARAQPAIIKLHGSRVGIRAGADVDDPPTREDMLTFAGYFDDADVDRGERHYLSQRRNLLVLGFSGSDLRIMNLLIGAIRFSRVCSPKQALRVFWVCHTEKDRAALRKHVMLVGGPDEAARFLTTTEDVQLLLHELYLTTTKTAPARGLEYDFIRDVPPHARSAISAAELRRWRERLLHGDAHRDDPTARRRLFVVTGNSELSSLAAELYWSLSGQERPVQGVVEPDPESPVVAATSPAATDSDLRRCLWIEPSTFSSPQALVHALVARVALKTGHPETGSILVTPEVASIKDACSHFSASPSQWVVFVYGRDGGGGLDTMWSSLAQDPDALDSVATTPLRIRSRSKQAHGPWADDEWSSFGRYLLALEAAGFTIFYMPFDGARLRFLDARLPGVTLGASDPLAGLADRVEESPHRRRQRTARVILEETVDWAMSPSEWPEPWTWPEDDSHSLPAELRREREREIRQRKLKFLHALCLIRQLRNRFMLFSRAAFPCANRFNLLACDNDLDRARFVEWAIRRLVEIGLLRRRPGGFVWMHRDVRLTLVGLLEGTQVGALADNLEPNATEQKTLVARVLAADYRGGERKAAQHLRLAESYEAAFRSTNNHLLVFEELYHLQLAVLSAPAARWEKLTQQENARRRRLLAERGLIRATRVLRNALPALLRGADQESATKLFTPEPPIELELVTPRNDTAPESARLVALFEAYRRAWRRVRAEFTLPGKPTDSPGPQQIPPEPGPSWEADAANLERLDEKRLATRGDRTRRNYHLVANELHATLHEAFSDDKNDARSLSRLITDLPSKRLGTRSDAVNLSRQLSLAAAAWLDGQLDAHRRSERLRLVSKVLMELAWLRVDELEDLALFCWTRPNAKGEIRIVEDWAANVGRVTRNREHARKLCILCDFALELSSFLAAEAHDDEDHDFVLLKSFYAHALGYLGRFTEAHRHLNDAFGRLTRSRLGTGHHYWALLELRRAAIYLYESQFKFIRSRAEAAGEAISDHFVGRACSERQVLAGLDDAWLALGRARDGMTGTTKAPRHWGRLAVYELRTLALLADLSDTRGHKTVGLPDRLAGGRLRLTYELVLSEAVLSRGTPVRGAQVAHAACLILRTELESQGRSQSAKDLALSILQLLLGWKRQLLKRAAPVTVGIVGEPLESRLSAYEKDCITWVDWLERRVSDNLRPG